MSSQTTNFPKLFLFERAKIMAVINTTPDSFYKNSRSQTEKDLLYLVENALNEGADWLDIGAFLPVLVLLLWI